MVKFIVFKGPPAVKETALAKTAVYLKKYLRTL